MKLKKSIKFYLICFALAGICFGKGHIAKAAETAYVELKSNTEYSQYDVTGDGEADKVVIKQVKNKENNPKLTYNYITLKVFINDQIALQKKEPYNPYWEVNLIKLANGKMFFEIVDRYDCEGNVIHRLYAYNKEKLKCVYDFNKYYKNYTCSYDIDIKKISGNTIKTEVMAQYYPIGAFHFNMNVKYQDGKFKRTSNKFTPNYKVYGKKNKWTARKKIKVYKKAGSKKLAYTLKKGNVIKINKIIYKNKKVYFQVKNKKGRGKTGYIPATKKVPFNNYPFEETEFAG